MCSLPTMNFNGAPPGVGVAAEAAAGGSGPCGRAESSARTDAARRYGTREPGIREPADSKVSQRQVVAVIVGGRIDLLSLFEKGRGVGDFARANIGLAQIVVGVEVARVEIHGLLELFGGEIEFPQTREIGGKIGSGGGRIGLQVHSLLEMLRGSSVLRLRGIDQSQEFLNFKAFWSFAH